MKIKKLIAIVLVVAACISETSAFWAKENVIYQGNKYDADVELNMDDFIECISVVAADAECLGYEMEDFEDICIGLPIHTYEMMISGEVKENDFVYYPVFSGDEVLFLICENEDGTMQMTQVLIDVISEYIGHEIAIVYDVDEAYILVDDMAEMKVACHFEAVSNERGNIVNKEQIKSSDVEWSKLEGVTDVEILANMVEPMYDAVMPTVTLAVPKVLQNYSNICWAASTASVGNYLTGKNYTAADIAKKLYSSDFNKKASLEESNLMLTHMYKITYWNISDNTAPTESRIYNNISSGYPLHGRWKASDSNTTHQTVIRGINHSAGYIYLMDPEQGYVTAKRSSGGGFSYVAKNGTKLILYGYLSMY